MLDFRPVIGPALNIAHPISLTSEMLGWRNSTLGCSRRFRKGRGNRRRESVAVYLFILNWHLSASSLEVWSIRSSLALGALLGKGQVKHLKDHANCYLSHMIPPPEKHHKFANSSHHSRDITGVYINRTANK